MVTKQRDEDGREGLLVFSIALAFVLLAQVVRTLFPIVYEASEDVSIVVAGVGVVAVYLAPILALPIVWLGSRRAATTGVVLLVAARLAVQLVHPIPQLLSMVATAAGLIGVTSIVVSIRDRLDAVTLTLGVVAGLALDTAIRALFRTWDLAWQASVPAILVTVVLVSATLATTPMLRRSAVRVGRPGVGRVWALGPYLMLQLLFLQNLGYVGSQGSVSFAAAGLVVLGGDALAVLVLSLLPDRVSSGLRALAAAAVAMLAASVETAHGVGVVALVLAMQVGLTGLLALALVRRPASRPPWRMVLGLTGASIAFALFTLLWQIAIDRPLPFPRELAPASAVALVGLASLRGTWLTAGRAGRQRALAFAAGLLGVSIVVAGWLWLDWPNEEPAPSIRSEVRVMSFNVRGAVGIAGQVDADVIADSILEFDPDVMLLQEVARGWPIHGAGDLLAYLQDRLDMPYVFQPAADGQFGNAILTRLPFEPLGGALLPEVGAKQGRSYLALRVDVSGTPLVVVNAHLEGDSGAQIEALLDAWGGVMPAVVAGDMNMQVSDEADVRRFTDAGLRDVEGATGDPCRATSAEPTSGCDRPSWMFVTSDLDIVSFRIGEPSASDHLPLYLSVSVPSK